MRPYGLQAKSAENIYFMFAVDPPKVTADRKDGKHKGQLALTEKNIIGVIP
jgi:hypothetical protein